MFNIQKDELRIVVYFHLHLVLGFQFQYHYKLHSTKQLILLKKNLKKKTYTSVIQPLGYSFHPSACLQV